MLKLILLYALLVERGTPIISPVAYVDPTYRIPGLKMLIGSEAADLINSPLDRYGNLFFAPIPEWHRRFDPLFFQPPWVR
jgi:hypothetical protein